MNFVSAISLAGPHVLVTSTFPDTLNRNPGIRSDLAEGFAELLGVERVVQSPLELAVSVIRASRPDVVVAAVGVSCLICRTCVNLQGRGCCRCGPHILADGRPVRIRLCFKADSATPTSS